MTGPIIAVDFDGTVVAHHFPEIGPDVPGAVDALRLFAAKGARLMLWTMRSDDHLAAAMLWFGDREIPLWAANRNPEQHTWSASKKQYAHLYIDDAALGCPLRHDLDDRPVVAWEIVTPLVLARFWPEPKKCDECGALVAADGVCDLCFERHLGP